MSALDTMRRLRESGPLPLGSGVPRSGGRLSGAIRRLGWVCLVVASTLQCAPQEPIQSPEVVPLLPDLSYGRWFEDQTGFAIDGEAFAAYVLESIDSTLYVGYSAGFPANTDGAVVAAYEGQDLRTIGVLDEQGVLDMTVLGGTLMIPGVDPCCPDGWAWGNFYTYDSSGGMTKHRNLPNTIHAWGTWSDPAGQDVYVATSAHPGDSSRSFGEIWRTADRGANWQLVASEGADIGVFRTLDVSGFAGALFAVSANEAFECALVREPDVTGSWKQLTAEGDVACYHRLAHFDDQLLALNLARDAIHVVRGTADARTVPLPFVAARVGFNWAAVAGALLYVPDDDGRIWMSRDLESWQQVTALGFAISALHFWRSTERLVVAQWGTGALWSLPLCGDAPC